MKILAGGCRVYSPEDGQLSTLGNWTARTVICRTQRRRADHADGQRLRARLLAGRVNPNAEEVLYVAAGAGVCHVNGFDYSACGPGCAVFVPPGDATTIENTGAETLRSSARVAPRIPQRHIVEQPLGSRVRRTAADSWCTKKSARIIRAGETASSAIWSIPTSAASR